MMDARLPRRDELNADQLQGFNMACACLMKWGAMIEQQGISLGGPVDPVPRSMLMAHGGRMVRNCAEAMALTIGRGAAVAVDLSPRIDLAS